MINYDYPQIFYGEAVQKDLVITDGTLTVQDDDYTISGDTVTITNDMLETEAFELHQSINSDSQLRFGSCESAYISFVFHAEANITTLKGKTLKVYIIPNHRASRILQIGVFKVDTDKLSYDGTQRQITAYDALYDILNSDVTDWYNSIFPNENTQCTVAYFRNSFLNHFDIEVEARDLTNDWVILHRTLDPEQLSGGDVIKAICEINAVFGRITNEGKFRYVYLPNNVRNISAESRHDFSSNLYSDFHSEDYDSKDITSLKIITDKDNYTSVISSAIADDNTYIISGNFLISDIQGATLEKITKRLFGLMGLHYYQPFTMNVLGNPSFEVGDVVRVSTKNGEVSSYILERHMKGIQALRDTYTANGEEYASSNLNRLSSRIQQVSYGSTQESDSAIVTANLEFVELIRNIGYRLLNEPSGVSVEYDPLSEKVNLIWTDPDDIAESEPVPATWAGTVVVRSDSKVPLHRWDGEIVEDSTIRDEYAETDLEDSDITVGKTYYYGIFPYDTRGWHRYTKVIAVTAYPMPIPDIVFLQVDHTDVTVTYSVPTQYNWSEIGIVYKKNSSPQSRTDGRTVDITSSTGTAVIEKLSGDSLYYFRIYSTEQTTSKQFLSDAQFVMTGKVLSAGLVEIIEITKSGTEELDFEEIITITQL